MVGGEEDLAVAQYMAGVTTTAVSWAEWKAPRFGRQRPVTLSPHSTLYN